MAIKLNIKKTVQKAGAKIASGAQKVGQTVKTGATNVKQATVKTAQKVAVKAATAAKKVLKAGEKVASISLFLPLKPLAKVFLKRRGITPASKNEEMIVQVYNEITKKSFGLIEGGDSFDYSGEAMEYGYADNFGKSFGMIPITPEMILAVVKFLKVIFDSIKAKKAKGEKLSSEEQDVLNSAPEIEAGLSEAKDSAEQILAQSTSKAAEIEQKGADDALSILNGEGNKKWILIIVIVIIIIIYFVMRKS
jgi:hypothetical protein